MIMENSLDDDHTEGKKQMLAIMFGTWNFVVRNQTNRN